MSRNLSVQRAFFEQLGAAPQLAGLFEELPDIYFFAKNLRGEFVMCNSATLEALGLKHESDMLGKTDYDLIPAEIADQYREADRVVIETASSVRNVVEPVPDAQGVFAWYVTSKIPLLDAHGKVIGVAVAMRDVERVGAVLGPYREMTGVIDYIFRHSQESFSVDELAEIAGLSVRQFERRFKKLFRMPPLRYVNQHRVRAACVRLRRSNDNVSTIAHEVGFYDHAHFVRQFKQTMNMTPTEYRKQYQPLSN